MVEKWALFLKAFGFSGVGRPWAGSVFFGDFLGNDSAARASKPKIMLVPASGPSPRPQLRPVSI